MPSALLVTEHYLSSLRRQWLAAAVPTFLQPLVLVLVFAVLIGRTAGNVTLRSGSGMEYATFVCIGIVLAAATSAAAADVMDLVFMGFNPDDTFRSVVTTPLSPTQLALGVAGYAFMRGTAVAAILLCLTIPILGFGSWVLWLPVLSILAGGCAAALAGLLGGVVGLYHKTPQVLNIASRLLLAPLVLFSAIFFPVSYFPPPVEWLVGALPLVHAADASRSIYEGTTDLATLRDAAIVGGWFVIGTVALVAVLRRDLSR